MPKRAGREDNVSKVRLEQVGGYNDAPLPPLHCWNEIGNDTDRQLDGSAGGSMNGDPPGKKRGCLEHLSRDMASG